MANPTRIETPFEVTNKLRGYWKLPSRVGGAISIVQCHTPFDHEYAVIIKADYDYV